MQYYRNYKTGEKVYVVDDSNDVFLKLNNGDQIKRDSFFKLYGLYADEQNQLLKEINESREKLETQINRNLIPNISNTPNYVKTDRIDLDDFFNQSSNLANMANKLSNVDTNKIVDLPDSMAKSIKVIDPGENVSYDNLSSLDEKKSNLINNYNAVASQTGQKTIQNQRLTDDDIRKKYMPVDENSDNIPLMNKNIRKDEIDNETGLNGRQLMIRQQAIEAGQPDPFIDKINKWREDKGLSNVKINPQISNNIIKSKTDEHDVMNMILSMFENDFVVKINVPIQTTITDPIILKPLLKKIKGDVVDYYTQEALNQLYGNVSEIKDMLYNEIYEKIHGEKLVKKSVKVKKAVKKKVENNKIENEENNI